MVPAADRPADEPVVPADFTAQFDALVRQYTDLGPDGPGRTVADLARAIVALDGQRRQLRNPEPGAVERWKKLIGDWRRRSLPEDSPEGRRRLGLALSVLGVPQAGLAKWWKLRGRTEAQRRGSRSLTDGAGTRANDSDEVAVSGDTGSSGAATEAPVCGRWRHDPTGLATLGVAYLGDVQLVLTPSENWIWIWPTLRDGAVPCPFMAPATRVAGAGRSLPGRTSAS